ncbi:MAG: protein kinase domain-containing protein [Planctomycetota bacterium]
MVSDGGSEPSSAPSSSGGDDELLEQLEDRIGSGEDPVGALAAVLSGRARRRSELFSWTGQLVLGYRLEQILGAGGTGVTYRATCAERGPVAIKLVVLSGGSSEERFHRECALLEGFAHDAIVSYRGHAVVEEGVGALVMELIEGVDLEQVLAEQLAGRAGHAATAALCEGVDGSPDTVRGSSTYVERVLLLLASVADGLAAVHETGVVHRDVKPANILVDAELQPTVIDFGFAREWDPTADLTMSGVAIGTLAYMAPEQINGRMGTIGAHTDTYALGLVLFRALLGRLPHAQLEELTAASRRPIRLAPEERARLPEPVQAVLERALQRDPRRRYGSAGAFAEHLRDAAMGRAVPRVGSRWWKQAAGVALAATLLMVALVWAPWSLPAVAVTFRANCRGEDAVVELAGGARVFLDEPIPLGPGVYEARLVGDRVYPSERTFRIEAAPGSDARQVVLVTQYLDLSSPPRQCRDGEAIVQFMSGHSLTPIAPYKGRDARWIDGAPVLDPGPFPPESLVSVGEHVFEAADALGRRESQRVAIGPMPQDVLLLPSAMEDVDGAFRCTWSSILSPRPEAVQMTHTGKRWLAPATPSPIGGAGLMALPCALTTGDPDETCETVVTVSFPAPMRSAVVALRSRCEEGAALEIEASLGGAGWVPWPRDPSGQFSARMALRSEQGADELRVRARMSADHAPTDSRAQVRVLQGVLFGGHWVDDPPCFAVVADPGERARLATGPARPSLQEAPQLVEGPRRAVHLEDVGVQPGGLNVRTRADGTSRVLMTTAGDGKKKLGVLSEWTWPDLELVRSSNLGAVLAPELDLESFAFQAAGQVVPLDDDHDDGGDDAPGDALVMAHGFPRGGYLNAGIVARVDLATQRQLWRAPPEDPTLPFGDEGFGHQFYLRRQVPVAGRSVERALLTVAHGYRARGVRVGKLSCLDVASGAQLWGVVGDRREPVSRLDGWICTGDDSWAVVASEYRTESTAPLLAGKVSAWRLDGSGARVILRTHDSQLLAAVAAGADGEERVFTSCVEAGGVISLQEHALRIGAAVLLREQQLQMPEQLVETVTGHAGWLRTCRDLDQDGLDDLVFFSSGEASNVEDATGRRSGAQVQVLALISSASLLPLGWTTVGAALSFRDVRVLSGPDGSPQLLCLITERALPNTLLWLARYQVR